MVVAKTTYTKYITLVGTLAEITQQLSDDNVPGRKVINIFYNGSNMTAVYWL